MSSRLQTALSNTPFAALTIIAAPAILTNSCSVLCLGIGNRIARVVDRTRVLTAALSNSRPESDGYKVVAHQIEILRSRSRLLVHALRLGYTALAGFAGATLTSVMGAALDFYNLHILSRSMAVCAFLLAALGVGSLVGSCILMVRESVRAISGLSEETELAVDNLAKR